MSATPPSDLATPHTPIPVTRRRVRLGLTLGAVLIAAVAVMVPALHFTAQGDYDAARESLAVKQSTAAPLVDAARSTLADAQTLLQTSAGRVLDEMPRTRLADAIVTADRRVGAVEDDIAASAAAAKNRPQSGVLLAGFPMRHSASVLATFMLDDAATLPAVTSTLAVPMRALTEAVAAWEAEQKRLRYTNNVAAAGWYPELDACIGSVDLTERYGIPTIAEHWSCGGRDFPSKAGTLIELTGLHSGTYRVDGILAMLNQSTATTADLPRGYDLLYQTCQNGQSSSMSITGLTKVD
ncbi:hypothetical protein [Glaciibacter psychrotolerans]|uniref:DUF4012 domain-containing protein n=1 Tax=Glaciibacter psychrotolerans TaxID=670054 RepID=A0A7Z0EH05_9MICO|nr:hypothetical protein [Leifsonia psychrotolerans]NYJ20747.1 hypothetical protein [Leifsonia psychrotolerans]